MRRMKTQLEENEENMRNYERLLHEVTQLYSTVTNELCNIIFSQNVRLQSNLRRTD